MTDAVTLAQDACARLCHDLGGAVGTIAGALELAGDDPEAIALAQEAAEVLRRRLVLWRAALGGAGDMAAGEAAGLIADGLLAGGRTRLEVAPEAAGLPLDGPAAQLLLLALAIGAEALPRGGALRLAAVDGGLAVVPDGPNAAWPAALPAALRGEPVAGPRAVLSNYLSALLAGSPWQADLVLGPPGAPVPLLLTRAEAGF
jgi:histidine phosphotransferase ChpT